MTIEYKPQVSPWYSAPDDILNIIKELSDIGSEAGEARFHGDNEFLRTMFQLYPNLTDSTQHRMFTEALDGYEFGDKIQEKILPELKKHADVQNTIGKTARDYLHNKETGLSTKFWDAQTNKSDLTGLGKAEVDRRVDRYNEFERFVNEHSLQGLQAQLEQMKEKATPWQVLSGYMRDSDSPGEISKSEATGIVAFGPIAPSREELQTAYHEKVKEYNELQKIVDDNRIEVMQDTPAGTKWYDMSEFGEFAQTMNKHAETANWIRDELLKHFPEGSENNLFWKTVYEPLEMISIAEDIWDGDNNAAFIYEEIINDEKFYKTLYSNPEKMQPQIDDYLRNKKPDFTHEGKERDSSIIKVSKKLRDDIVNVKAEEIPDAKRNTIAGQGGLTSKQMEDLGKSKSVLRKRKDRLASLKTEFPMKGSKELKSYRNLYSEVEKEAGVSKKIANTNRFHSALWRAYNNYADWDYAESRTFRDYLKQEIPSKILKYDDNILPK